MKFILIVVRFVNKQRTNILYCFFYCTLWNELWKL